MPIQACDLSLIAIHISGGRQFSNIHVSQGSVATYVRCGGIFKHQSVANLPLSRPAKKGKSVSIWGSYEQEFGVLFFDSQCSIGRRNTLIDTFCTQYWVCVEVGGC